LISAVFVEIDHLARHEEDEPLRSLAGTPCAAGGVEKLMRLQLLHLVGIRVEATVT
jgi:hypothetical protein